MTLTNTLAYFTGQKRFYNIESKVEELRVENLKLKDDLAAVSHNKLMEGEQGLETLKLRNKFLQVTHGRYYKNF